MSSGKSGQILNNRQKKKEKKMEVLLPEAGMIEKKKRKHDSEHTCRVLPQGLLHAPRGHEGVLHRPDQTSVPLCMLQFPVDF
jgi:hypothetical protein